MTRFLGYIAMSIDGRIADGRGGMEWLQAFDNAGTDHGYAAFYAEVDALVMGRATYDFVAGMTPWPYAGRPCYVVTGRTFDSGRPDVTPAPPDFAELKAHLQEQGFDRVWVVGGGRTQRAALDAGMFDELRLFVMPVVLGSGPLVFADGAPANARLTAHRIWPSGAAELTFAFDAA